MRALLTVLVVLVLVLPAGAAVADGYDARVEAAQARLSELGYDPGPIDGLMGRRTRAALRRFQRDHGLVADGVLGPRTRAALRAAAVPAEPPPPAPAPAEPPAPTPGEPPPSPAPGGPPAAGTAPTPQATPPAPEAARAPAPSPARAPAEAPAGTVIPYTTLGWRAPASGAEVLERFRRNRDSPLLGRGLDELIVPDASKVYLLARGERVPGFDCDPGAARLALTLLMGYDGPLSFRVLGAEGYCRLGFGIALAEGTVLRMEPASWAGARIRAGRVRIGARGLEYLGR